jgi:hypothetical protein
VDDAKLPPAGGEEVDRPSADEDAKAREAKKKAALEDFTRRTQKGLALIIIPFGVLGLISLTLLMTRGAPNPRPEISERALDKALYDATLVHLKKLQRQRTDLETQAKKDPNQAAKLSDHEQQILQTREMLASECGPKRSSMNRVAARRQNARNFWVRRPEGDSIPANPA